MRPAVELKEIVKRFGKFTAVDRISLEVSRGEIFGFLGPNGAGKSTTIRMLCGLLRPTSGKGFVNGLNIFTEQELIKANLGYMSQRFSLYDDLRVEENMRLFGGIYGLKAGDLSRRIDEALDLISLKEKRAAMTRELPSGLKQRLALGCALLHRPPMVFLDEPTSGVDPATRRSFWDLIYRLAEEGVTVFVTTHYMEEAEYCGRIGLIDKGRLIALGTPAELKERHLQGRIFEIPVSDPLAAVEALKTAGGVLDAAIFGSSVHVRVKKDVDPDKEVLPFLASSSVKSSEMRAIEPSLEDVFVALVGKRQT